MSQGPDPFEFIKNFWASMPGMGAGTVGGGAMPSFDPQDLEKRLTELKQVKQWLEMNLNMLNLQINTIEMQLTAVHNFENFTHSGSQAGTARKAAPHEAPDLSQANEAAGAAARAASDAGAQAFAQGAQALQAMPWANPGEWIKSMQAAFAVGAPTQASAKKSAARASASSSAGTATNRSAAKKRASAKRPRKAP